ncbi:stem 28 kDa glycoprotein-like [Oryza brachyantha]|uniref:stem 28 kDa glycoprotein-like n=1 Tax=Oryza brachyantha TaxID=4533 RepID=UPI001ADA5F74|nr:stem 28 kDa glycoprotein-like [Oryza brachyantha]
MATARLLLLLAVAAAAGSACFCSGQQATPAPATPPPPPPPPPYCGSVRMAVEAHNIVGWKTVPADCAEYVADYMSGERYERDSGVVVDQAIAYAESIKVSGKGKEIWIFDVDETALSTLPYQAKHGYGAQPYDQTSYLQYVAGESSPALQGTLRLYRRLLQLGIKPVFLTDRTDDQSAVTTHNLLQQGYCSWEKLLLQPAGLQTSTQAFKTGERQKLVAAGYAIVGNIGDQWSDILGSPEGCRTFKLPNPMYYVA